MYSLFINVTNNAYIGLSASGMLISDFSKIRISNLKIRYKSGYRFWLCRSRPENSDSVFPYFGLVVRSLQLYCLSERRRRLMIASAASRHEWGEGNWADWLTAHGRHPARYQCRARQHVSDFILSLVWTRTLRSNAKQVQLRLWPICFHAVWMHSSQVVVQPSRVASQRWQLLRT